MCHCTLKNSLGNNISHAKQEQNSLYFWNWTENKLSWVQNLILEKRIKVALC